LAFADLHPHTLTFSQPVQPAASKCPGVNKYILSPVTRGGTHVARMMVARLKATPGTLSGMRGLMSASCWISQTGRYRESAGRQNHAKGEHEDEAGELG